MTLKSGRTPRSIAVHSRHPHRGRREAGQSRARGHNCQIGAHSVIAAQAGLSGSCVFGKRVLVGGQAGFGERCKLEDASVIGGQSGVLGGKTIRSGETVWEPRLVRWRNSKSFSRGTAGSRNWPRASKE